MTEPRPIAPEDCFRSLRDGQTLATLAGACDLAVPLLEVVEDLADAEEAHRDDDEVDAVGELQAVEGEADRAGEAVPADGGQQQADGRGDQRLELVAVADRGDQQDAEQRQRGVLRRAEVQREARHDRRQQRQPDDRDGAADEGADGRDAEGGAGLALFGQLRSRRRR